MAVKLQFQFAGVDLSRPSSPHRKWFRMGLATIGVLTVSLAYWAYLHHLTHGSHRSVPVAHAAPAVPPAIEAAKNTTPIPAATAPVVAQTPAEPASVATAAPVESAPPVPVAKPVAASVTAPGVRISFDQPVQRVVTRQHTEQELLLMAGMTAFGNVMTVANKYPDAYGFNAEDFLGDAKLGDPIPVYTIDERDRANYRTGQPLKPLLKPCNRWVFPVMMGDRICCMVQVKKAGKEFVPGAGSKSLAMAWTKILENWPADQGYHPQLVVNPQIPGYYFTVPELSMPNMTDTVMMTYFNPCTSPADVILASWR